MHRYNHHFPDDATPESLTADREKMLKEHFGKVGKGVFIEPPVNVDYGCNISLGDGFYSNFKYVLLEPQHLQSCNISHSNVCTCKPRNPRLRYGAHRR